MSKPTPANGGNPLRHEMKRIGQAASASSGYAYSACVRGPPINERYGASDSVR